MPEDTSRFTLHVAGAGDLARLGRQMDNCLASYGRGRVSGRDRIVEVREDGRTRYAVHIRNGRVVMFEAAGNRPPARDDVPIVHDLLSREGHLAATRPRPPARPRQRQRPRTSAPRPGLSVQGLAADLLRPPTLGSTEWPELAAALWAAGVLPLLVDPGQHAYVQVVRDLAERIATSGMDDLPRRDPPAPEERAAARRRLLAGPPPRRKEDWQRHRMAEILAAPLTP